MIRKILCWLGWHEMRVVALINTPIIHHEELMCVHCRLRADDIESMKLMSPEQQVRFLDAHRTFVKQGLK